MSLQTIAADDWVALLAPLRQRYVEELPLALAHLERCLGRLAANPADAEALTALLRRFHSTAGSGGTYGFPALSTLCAAGEAACTDLIAGGQLPGAEQLAAWQSLVAELGREIAAARAATGDASGSTAATARTAATAATARVVATAGTEASAGTEALPPSLSSPRGARILAMEDDPAQALYIRTVLEGAGYAVTTCEDPHRFAAELAASRPDLVLMDVVLPQSDGYELVRSLRQETDSARLPVLFLTTEGQMKARLESAWAGGDDLLVKPVPPALLLAQIEERLARVGRVQALLERDPLTRLLSRDTFLARLRTAAETLRRRPLLALLDLDRMKPTNNRHGRKTGDRVLAATAQRLRRDLPLGTAAGRFGGDRFAVLFTDLRPRQAAARMDDLRRALGDLEHLAADGTTFRVTVSAGLAELRPRQTLDDWLAVADGALHAAKSSGRNRLQVA